MRYPDDRAEIEWFLLDRRAGTDDSPKLPPGDTPWTYYQGAPFHVEDPAIVVGKPVLEVKNSSGTVFFDDLTLEELDAAGAGAIRFAFENDRGGLRWVGDMLDLLEARGLSFSYHSYHEDAFGIYRGGGTLPSAAQANAPLIELFTRKLAPAVHRAAQ